MGRDELTRVARLLLLGALAVSLCPGGLALAAAAEGPAPLRPLDRLAPYGAWGELPRNTSLIELDGVHPVRAGVDYGEYDARFGADRGGRMHEGQDMFAPAGTPIVAVRDGVVLDVGDDGGRGNYLALWNADAGETYVYFHMLNRPRVEKGERVAAGDMIGKLGCTGSCWGDHLHFEVRSGRDQYSKPRNPMPLLRSWAANSTR